MRLTGGSDGGHSLVSPRGDDIRPTSDRVREALFSILRGLYGALDGERVLDVFAGAGTLGLECLSRGAGSAVFADINSRSLAALEQNLDKLRYRGRAEVIRQAAPDVMKTLHRKSQAFDLIFMDPPYGDAALEPTLKASRAILKASGMVVAEHDRADILAPAYDLPEGRLERVDQRQYGRTLLSFYRTGEADAAEAAQEPAVDASLEASVPGSKDTAPN